MRSDLKAAWERFTRDMEAYEKAHPDWIAEGERWFLEGEANEVSDEEADALKEENVMLTEIHPSDIRFMRTDDDFRMAVENYEIAESLSAIRFSNKEANSIYNAAFEAACAAMNDVAEDRGCTYEDVLAAVRKEACC